MSEKYNNDYWGFSLDLGNHWYESSGFGVWPFSKISTIKNPIFRQDRFPIQANIKIGGDVKRSWNITSNFAAGYMQRYGHNVLEEHHITVCDTDQYAISYMLEGLLPTRKYSIVLEHPKCAKQYIEFAFTISVYGSTEDFIQNIEEGDRLVESFKWLE